MDEAQERAAAVARHPAGHRPKWQQLALLPDFPHDEPMKLRRVQSARKVRQIRVERLRAV